MLKKLLCLIFLLVILLPTFTKGQDISLFTQVNGRYDFTFVGNTMNIAENNPTNFYVTNTSSSATLNLGPSDTIIRAYLYWAGSGDGDFEVDLNGTTITPDRTFSHSRFFNPNTFTYFSAFKDITTLVQTTGNGTYTLSNLDISPFEALHYSRKTNFAGWAILTLNQLNIYDGLQGVPDALQINLTNLYVLNNANAKAGFIAWEGDSQLATENFTVNSTVISNPFNPPNNVFNSTNSVTGSNQLYNMDLDIYNIQNNINVGDTQALIQLTSQQDYVMVNAIVTKLNSQLPDARISFTQPNLSCNVRELTLNYTITNFNSTADLPTNTPITFYADGVVIGSAFTQNIIPMDGFETGTITVTIPSSIPLQFNLMAQVDDIGNGTGIINEISETNNSFSLPIRLFASPNFNQPEDVLSCNLGFTRAIFDFSSYENSIQIDATDLVTFYEIEADAIAEINQIGNTSNYEAITTPKTIWVRIENTDGCFSTASFLLKSRNCEPIVYNAVSPNNDGLNDFFYISGLRDIFLNYKLEVYNRWGRLIWTGDNSKPDWNGKAENAVGNDDAPGGTYYYILHLNDSDYPNPINGYLLLKR